MATDSVRPPIAPSYSSSPSPDTKITGECDDAPITHDTPTHGSVDLADLSTTALRVASSRAIGDDGTGMDMHTSVPSRAHVAAGASTTAASQDTSLGVGTSRMSAHVPPVAQLPAVQLPAAQASAPSAAQTIPLQHIPSPTMHSRPPTAIGFAPAVAPMPGFSVAVAPPSSTASSPASSPRPPLKDQAGHPNKPRARANLPRETTTALRGWLLAHADNPYPTEQEKEAMCETHRMSLLNLNNWFINARRRYLAPGLELRSASRDAPFMRGRLGNQVGSQRMIAAKAKKRGKSQSTAPLPLSDGPPSDSSAVVPRGEPSNAPSSPPLNPPMAGTTVDNTQPATSASSTAPSILTVKKRARTAGPPKIKRTKLSESDGDSPRLAPHPFPSAAMMTRGSPPSYAPMPPYYAHGPFMAGPGGQPFPFGYPIMQMPMSQHAVSSAVVAPGSSPNQNGEAAKEGGELASVDSSPAVTVAETSATAQTNPQPALTQQTPIGSPNALPMMATMPRSQSPRMLFAPYPAPSPPRHIPAQVGGTPPTATSVSPYPFYPYPPYPPYYFPQSQPGSPVQMPAGQAPSGGVAPVPPGMIPYPMPPYGAFGFHHHHHPAQTMATPAATRPSSAAPSGVTNAGAVNSHFATAKEIQEQGAPATSYHPEQPVAAADARRPPTPEDRAAAEAIASMGTVTVVADAVKSDVATMLLAKSEPGTDPELAVVNSYLKSDSEPDDETVAEAAMARVQ